MAEESQYFSEFHNNFFAFHKVHEDFPWNLFNSQDYIHENMKTLEFLSKNWAPYFILNEHAQFIDEASAVFSGKLFLKFTGFQSW